MHRVMINHIHSSKITTRATAAACRTAVWAGGTVLGLDLIDPAADIG